MTTEPQAEQLGKNPSIEARGGVNVCPLRQLRACGSGTSPRPREADSLAPISRLAPRRLPASMAWRRDRVAPEVATKTDACCKSGPQQVHPLRGAHSGEVLGDIPRLRQLSPTPGRPPILGFSPGPRQNAHQRSTRDASAKGERGFMFGQTRTTACVFNSCQGGSPVERKQANAACRVRARRAPAKMRKLRRCAAATTLAMSTTRPSGETKRPLLRQCSRTMPAKSYERLVRTTNRRHRALEAKLQGVRKQPGRCCSPPR